MAIRRSMSGGLSDAEKATLAAGIRASSDPSVVAALSIRDDITLWNWCNTDSTSNAWNDAADSTTMFEAMNLTTYDSVAAGKRAAWDIMLRMAPINFIKNKMRNAILDIFAAGDANAMLNAVTRKATNAEVIFGGTNATSGTVTAMKLTLPGTVDLFTVSDSLNRF